MNIRVFGSINQDLVAYVESLPVPGETTLGQFSKFPGGKGANQAIAAARGGGTVEMFGATGDDDAGVFMRDVLSGSGIDVSNVDLVATPTGVALILVDASSENIIAVCPGANLEALSARAYENFSGIALAQGETDTQQTENFILGMKKSGATTIVNPAPYGNISNTVLDQVDFLILNEIELAQHVGFGSPTDSKADVAAILPRLTNTNVIVTLGRKGLVARLSNEIYEIDAPVVEAIDTVGAGDCFCGYFAAQLSLGRTALESLKIAVLAASISVTREGAASSIPTLDEIALDK